MKKILIIVLVILMLLVPMSAFAAAGTGSDGDFENSTAGTDFLTEVDISQISVTVPVSVTFVAPVGGGSGIFPTAAAYKITNNSSMAVHVSNLVAELDNTSATKTTPISFATVAQDGQSAVKNAFYSTIQAGADTPWVFSTTAKTSFTNAWNVDASNGTTAGTLGLTLAGSNSPLDITNTSAIKVFKIMFTIAPGELA